MLCHCHELNSCHAGRFLIASHLAQMGEGIYDCIMQWVVNTGQSDLYMQWEYSGTSDSGLSK